ncbi:hypothetical protein S83_040030 [Arachis hypogaea]
MCKRELYHMRVYGRQKAGQQGQYQQCQQKIVSEGMEARDRISLARELLFSGAVSCQPSRIEDSHASTFPNTIIFSFHIDECQQLFTPLSYQIGYTLKPLLDVFQDPALSSKIQVHPDGQVTFLGFAIEMKDFLSLVAESYLSQIS